MDAFNDNMITLKELNKSRILVVEENFQKYYILREDFLYSIIYNLHSNNLLLLFFLSCFSTFICCNIKRKKNNYTIIQQAEPVIKGEIV